MRAGHAAFLHGCGRAICAFAAVMTLASKAAAAPTLLEVAPGGHMLQTADGKPFFWLADTAWELIHRATPHEASFYLRTRARQGFTVVMTVVLAEDDGLRTPTPDGLTPFAEADPAWPNAAYFDRVAKIVDEAGALGLYVALLPTWGDKVTAPWGVGPRIFTADRLPAARAYGRFLGARLKGRTNLVWVLGGDRPVRLDLPGGTWFGADAVKAGWRPDEDWTPVWRALAEGLREGSGAPILTAWHPQGGEQSSSVQLPDAPWLSIHGLQSGHNGGRDLPVWEWVARDHALSPAKPVIDLEPNYEDHPVNPWPRWNPADGYFRDDDVRRQTWRAVLAGAAGATYGHHAVWQWAGPRNAGVNHVDRDWVSALHRPGAEAMRPLRDLMLSRPYRGRTPDPAMIVGEAGEGARHMVAARGADGGYAIVFVPGAGRKVTVDLARIHARAVRAWWFDPRTGRADPIGEVAAHGPAAFTTPSHGADWALVLDDAAAGFPQPGFPADPLKETAP